MHKHLIAAALLIGASTAMPSSAQSLKDLFKELGKQVQQKVDEKIEEKIVDPCRQKESVAEITSLRDLKVDSWVVEATDGRQFQLSNFAIAGTADDGNPIAQHLSKAASADFGLLDSSRLLKSYRVTINYRDLIETGSSSALVGVLSATLNNTARKTMRAEFKFETGGVEGTSTKGDDWCLAVPTTTLRSLRFVKGNPDAKSDDQAPR